jgi:hypothetical protein
MGRHAGNHSVSVGRPSRCGAPRRGRTRAREARPSPSTRCRSAQQIIKSNAPETATNLDEALHDIRRARALAPGRDDYAFGEAHVLVERRDFAEARKVLGPMLSTRYHPVAREQARSLMSQVVRIESAAGEAQGRRRQYESAAPDDRAGPRNTGAETGAIQPVFRKIQDGEQRTEGLLERIECVRQGVVLHVRVGDAVNLFAAPRFEAIDFISYRDEIQGALKCEPRTPADPIYITWRPPVAPVKEGIAIAVEFLPKR